MPYNITGSVTFSSQANRDAALTRVNTALSSYALTNVATVYPAGVNTSGTTAITISLQDGNDGEFTKSAADAIMSALVQSNRHTSGTLSVNRL